MTVQTPPAALSEAIFGCPDLSGRDFGAPDARKGVNFDIILATFSDLLGHTANMAPRLAPGTPNRSKLSRKIIPKASETDPE